MARRNLRNGLGVIAIPERIAPTSLEALQADVARRQSGAATAPPTAPGAPAPAATVLPGGRTAAAFGGVRPLRLVVALHGVTLLLSAAGSHHSASHRGLSLALAGALLLAALVMSAAPVAGLVAVVVAEATLVFLDLTAGHDVAVTTRIRYLFLPVCVLLVAAQSWPRRET